MARRGSRSSPSGGSAAAGATQAVRALAAAGVGFTEHPYDHDPSHGSYGDEAADALELDPDAVFKTLLADASGELVVAVVPVSSSVDLKALAQAAGAKRARLADAADAERVTGYVVGGISPLGQRSHLRTFVDVSALSLERMYVSGGRRGFDIGLAPVDLMRLTDAVAAPIARRG
jgi:Cys-tRNA(Pro)/Cys-tRNA(Cys) deacylase